MNNNYRNDEEGKAEGELYRSESTESSGAGNRRKFWFFAAAFSVILLILGITVLSYSGNSVFDFSWDDLTGKPAATINGERISRSDLRVRLKNVRRMLEQQHGKDIFSGESGKSRFISLKKQVLDMMVEERLIAQEAQRLGIRINDVAVEKELQRVAGEIYGIRENFQKRFVEEGITLEDLKSQIRNVLTTQAMIQMKSAPGNKELQQEVYFDAWLVQAKKSAKLIVYDTAPSVSGLFSGGGSCCDTGGSSRGCGGSGTGGSSGGCGSKTSGPMDAQTEKKATTAGLEAYKKINGDTKDLAAKVIDYGCHTQVDITKDGKVLKSYNYIDGQISEI